MHAQWSHFVMGSIALAFVASSAACGPVTIDQGGGGNAGMGGAAGAGGNTTTASSTGSGGEGGATLECDPMNLPPEGTPCMTDGEFCGPKCEDPCSFCNVMRCSEGAWTNIEVFPAPCLSCDDVCVPVVAAQCSGGPPDQMSCVQGCMQNQMKCMIPFNQMLGCIGMTPTFTCDAMNRPTVAGCEMQFDKLYACIMP